MQLSERLKKLKRLKILIIRLKPVGDTILISAVFRNLKRIFPESRIDIVVYPLASDAVGKNPYIHKVLILPRKNLSKLFFYLKLPFLHYDVTLDYINNPTSCFISLFSLARIRIGRDLPRNFFYTHRYYFDTEEYSARKSLEPLKFLGLKDFNDFMPEFFVHGKDEKKAGEILRNTGVLPDDKLIGIFASAKYPTRKYVPEGYALLARLIQKDFKVKVLFLFGKNDLATFKIIYSLLAHQRGMVLVPDDISLGEMAGIMKRLSYLITNDTGPKHLATALNIPTLTIFGATDDRVWNPPDRKRFAVIRNQSPCSPCNELACDTLECMKTLKPQTIYRKLKPILKKYL